MPIPRPPRALVVALALPMLAAATAPTDVRFADVTAAVGLTFTHANSATSNKYLIETMGGGVALLDYDHDGRLDVFFVNGARLEDPMPAGKTPDKREPAYWNRLYRQRPDGTFTDVMEAAGLTRRATRRPTGSRGATTTTTATPISTSPATAATRCIATTVTAPSPT